jgi:hypothetical protein
VYCSSCGSDVRDDAQFCGSCGSKQDERLPQTISAVGTSGSKYNKKSWMSRHPVWTIVLLGFVVGLLRLSIPVGDSSQNPVSSEPSKPAPAPAVKWIPGIGETAKVSSFGGGSDVLAFVSEEALDKYKTASLNGQDSGKTEFVSLMAAGKIIATRKGTSVSVVKASGWNGWRKVRFVNGEHAGRAAYLLDQWTVYSK